MSSDQFDQKPKGSPQRRAGIKRRDLLLGGTSLDCSGRCSRTRSFRVQRRRIEVLPFPPTPSGSTSEQDDEESVYSPRPAVRQLPANAPNILIVILDDVGPALPSTYGGAINTPTLDRIHQSGISFNRFHTTAMCSPTRAALLTGRNHHRVGSGQLTGFLQTIGTAIPVPIPKSSATVAKVLEEFDGYANWGMGADGTIRRQMTPLPPDRSSFGRRATASNISTVFSPARPGTTSRTCFATPRSSTPIRRRRASRIT